MTGADHLIQTLEALGVEIAYGVPGEETTALLSALQDSQITFVLCRHEQAAAFMASVYGRLHGKPAICLATLGPGATNLVTGVADAHLDYAPMIVLTGQAARARLGRESHQVIDLEALFAPITKRSRLIQTADNIAGFAAEAYATAMEPRPGPVHLCLPEDLASEQVDPTHPISPIHFATHPVPAQDIEALATHLTRAERPMIIAGAGVIRQNSVAALRSFIEATGIPCATSFSGKGILADGHARHLGVFGLPGRDDAEAALHKADLLFAVGYDPIEYEPHSLSHDGRIPVIALSEGRLPHDSGWPLKANAAGSISTALADLTHRIDGLTWNMHAARPERPTGPADDLAHPDTILARVNSQIHDEDIILSGVGNHKFWIADRLQPRSPGQIIIPNGLAGMGLALPGAIAAKHANKEAFVMAICGDGDVMMNVQDLETATRLDLDLVVMVWVDGGYGLIEQKQRSDTGDDIAYGFSDMDWAALARAFGFEHCTTRSPDTLSAILDKARKAGGRHLITLPVRYPEKIG